MALLSAHPDYLLWLYLVRTPGVTALIFSCSPKDMYDLRSLHLVRLGVALGFRSGLGSGLGLGLKFGVGVGVGFGFGLVRRHYPPGPAATSSC